MRPDWRVSLANRLSRTSNGHWELVGGRGQEGIVVVLDRDFANTIDVEDGKIVNLAILGRIQDAAERMYREDRAFPYLRDGRYPYKKIALLAADLVAD